MYTPRDDKETVAYLDGMLAMFLSRRGLRHQNNPYKLGDGCVDIDSIRYRLYEIWHAGMHDAYIGISFHGSTDENL